MPTRLSAGIWVSNCATPPAGATKYTYDATGNRTAKIVAGTTYTNTVAPTSIDKMATAPTNARR